jgi:hypothetical protein
MSEAKDNWRIVFWAMLIAVLMLKIAVDALRDIDPS